jgi:outer membrane protein assembly factor BamD
VIGKCERYFLLGALLLLGCLMGCGSSSQLTKKERGDKAYGSGDYLKAIEEYQIYLEESITGADAIDAQFMLAKSYFGNRDYPTAAVEFEIFQRDYPRSDSLLAAAYYEALCWVKQSPPFDRDASITEKAIRELENFLLDFPGNSYAPQARDWIGEMLDKLARKKLENARLYKRLRRAEAAIIYYELLLRDFPGCSYRAEAMLELMETYVEQGRRDEADAILRSIQKTEPGSELERLARELLATGG